MLGFLPSSTIFRSPGDMQLTQVTGEDGTYKFGPLDASQTYSIKAEKESYVFSDPDENGDILVHKLAEINVELIDDADGTPLQVMIDTYTCNLSMGITPFF